MPGVSYSTLAKKYCIFLKQIRNIMVPDETHHHLIVTFKIYILGRHVITSGLIENILYIQLGVKTPSATKYYILNGELKVKITNW